MSRSHDPFSISISEVVSLLRWPSAPNGRSSYNISCPYCDGTGKKKHLNINLLKNTYRCPKCDFAGGVLDLYCYYNSSVARSDAFRVLSEELGMDIQDRPSRPKPKQQSMPVSVEIPLANIEVRDATYRALFEKLSLAKDHKESLRSRGLSDEAIIKNLYRSTPVIGFDDYARQLIKDGFQLAGVPGFYKEKGIWTLLPIKRGILVPALDLQNRIQGLHIRLDDDTYGKFRWMSSRDRNNGCGAHNWTHIAGLPREETILIEGYMKANIVHHLTGQTVVAVPGVNALEELRIFLRQLKELGIKKIMTAFDMDMLCNPNVQEAFIKLRQLLYEEGFRYGTYVWDPLHNGLDDYIWDYIKSIRSKAC